MMKTFRSPLLLALPLAVSGALPSQSQPSPFRINEVSVCGPDYVEIQNTGTRPAGIGGLRLSTSQGSFDLGATSYRIQPGDYFVLARGPQALVGLSDNQAVRMQIVSQPLLGALGDTVVLEDLAGGVIDAMCYGAAADNSPRYASAVAAGQFAAGQFVDIGNCYGGVAIGRDGNGTDSNDLAADWRLHGGRDAYSGSPFAANTAIVGDEETTIESVQARVNQILLNIYATNVVQASASGYTGPDSASTATHTFQIDSPELGTAKLTGAVPWTFVGGNDGDHTIHYGGVLAEANGDRQLAFDVIETLVGTTRTLTLATDLSQASTSTHRRYSERLTLADAGARGSHTVTQTRSLTDWFGLTRGTRGTCRHHWNLQGGALVDIAATIDITRDWPIVPNPLGDGPNPPVTVETLHTDVTAADNGSGVDLRFGAYTADYGSLGRATHRNASIVADIDPLLDTVAVTHTDDIDFVSSSGTTTVPLRVNGKVTAVPDTDHAALVADLFRGASLVGTYTGFIDPPSATTSTKAGIDWDKWKRRLKKAAKKVAQAGAIFVVGAWCALTTFGCGLIAVAGAVTVWVAVLGVLGVAFFGGLCAVLLWIVTELFGMWSTR